MGTTAAFRMRDVLGTVHRVVKDPFAWSAIGSLGLHVLIFGTFPIFAASQARQQSAEIKGAVDVVELTPSEQERLPDIALTPTDLPPLPNFATPNSPNSPLLVPPSGSFFAAPPPQPIFVPAPQSTMLPSIGFSTPYVIQPPAVRSSITIPVPETPAQPPVERLTPSLPQSSTQSSTPTPPANSTPTPSQPNSTSPASPTPPAPNIAQIQQQRMAQLRAEQRVQRERFAIAKYNANGVADGEGRSLQIAFVDWFFNTLNRKDKDDVKQKDINLTLPPEACLIQGNQAAVVGVVVDRQGKIVDKPNFNRILVSSGYDYLNQKALEAAQAESYGSDQSLDEQPYQVTVTFKDELNGTCPSPTPTTAPTSTPAT